MARGLDHQERGFLSFLFETLHRFLQVLQTSPCTDSSVFQLQLDFGLNFPCLAQKQSTQISQALCTKLKLPLVFTALLYDPRA